MERLLEILALLQSPEGISDDDLAALESELQDLFDEIRTGDLDDDAVEALGQIADAVDAVRTVAAERIAAAEAEAEAAAAAEAARAQRVAELEARLHPTTGDTDEVTEEVEAETTEEVEAEAPEVEPVAEVEPEPVAAAATPPAAPTPVAQLAARRPARHAPQPQQRAATPTVRIRSAGGGEFTSRTEVEDALLTAWRDLDRAGGGRQVRRVATFQAQFPEDRRLGGRVSDVTDQVEEIRQAAFNPGHMQSLTADGGLCAPVNVWYDLQTVAQAARPLRASLPNFDASRGGIKYTEPMQLSDIASTGGSPDQAIGSMTEAQDAAGATNKTYQMIACGDEVEVKVGAYWRQLQFGNMVARTNPERTSQFTDLSLAAFARYNEQDLWTKMLALCTHINGQQELGALRDLLTVLNRAAINYRSVLRMPIDAPVEVRLPAWVGVGLAVDDQTNSLQSYPEQFEVTAARVEQLLALRNIRVAAWTIDEFTTAAANAGAVNAYPSTFKVILNHPGAFVYVDGGTLDLGVIRDGDMVNDNTFRVFDEEFWNVAMWGVAAWDIEFSLCANGASAGSIAPQCGS